ncbi:ABC transporter ATP-binding protein [Chlamydiifrater phoenicopteri]|uniref:ABC transporter ATP-binding protein n=1 Tax=Chlamydiifrater phoenicopteri TaxID=2681469 RepID=UPI001BCABEDA|nr:ABC transporter ATP-binding protein [Chlamydiifrater phoenicopteri]
MPRSPILQVADLNVSLVKQKKIYSVVESVSFDLYKQKTLAIIGESGSGKSLTAQALLGLLPKAQFITKGLALYQQQNLLTLPPKAARKIRGNKIAMIFQNPMASLNPVYTIGHQLTEVVYTHLGIPSHSIKELLFQALHETRIQNPDQCLKSYPHQLSGGMLQRICIAMALLCHPDILIADEPTTALDVSVQHQILSLLRDLQEKTGMAILIITHNMGVVAEIADEVTVLYAGRIIERGSAQQIFDNPSHPYTQALFASRPNLAGQVSPYLSTMNGSPPHPTQYPSGCRFHPRCSKVMEKCKQCTPPNLDIGDNHEVRCWLYDY